MAIHFSKIVKSKDYDKYTDNPHNRGISQHKLKVLHSKMIVEGYNPAHPIIVNPQNVILSGHHRIRVARELGLEFPVMVDYIHTIQQLNIMDAENPSHWPTIDTVKAFAIEGKPSYQTVLDVMNEFNVGLSVTASLLKGGCSAHNGSITRVLKSGEYQVGNLQESKELLAHVLEFKPFAEGSYHTTRQFIKAVQLMVMKPSYRPKVMLSKLEKNSGQFKKQTHFKFYEQMLCKIYNHGMKQDQKLTCNLIP